MAAAPEHEDDTPVHAVGTPGASNPLTSQSVVDLFKQEQAEIASAKDVKIPVKGYEQTGLQIQYHMPADGKELDAIGTRINKQTKDAYSRNLFMAMDTMIHLCDGLFVQPNVEGEPEVTEPVILDPDGVGEPMHFDERLARMMGMNEPEQASARQVVKRLFGNNELAIINHAERLNRWLQNTKADLNAEIWQLGD